MKAITGDFSLVSILAAFIPDKLAKHPEATAVNEKAFKGVLLACLFVCCVNILTSSTHVDDQ